MAFVMIARQALFQLKSSTSVKACVKECKHDNSNSNVVQLPEKTRNSSVLVLGGTGRVGGSTATALSKFCPDLRIVIGGRNREKGAAMVGQLGRNSEFTEVNIENVDSLGAALKDVDLVVHAAGPFQQAAKCTVLEAAIETKTAYVDVCDDTSYALRAKSFKDKALAANIPAITTGGIYPGVSNVMAAELVRAAKTESKGKPERLRNLPEVRSAHDVLGIPTVSARFGTAPFFWNWGMSAMTNLLSPEFLKDRTKVQQLVQLFDPLVRAVDGIAGERVSMRVDLECTDGRNTLGLFSHRKLSVSVGNATAAFALAVLEGSTQPGVWFPEEPEGIAIEARELLLNRATEGTINFIMNKPPWMVETDPKELGLGIYV
ncbi:hypothetical protein POPTR_009G050100v4 [Populus trichocarpa]|uniref:Uncharacterized protein n=1 Tax=Populus trichocarpa TaxID=3694 RepID=A0ACC0SGK7_POPTR|nr:hypothetical protein BDE02_09G042400 [Populus trichocarpa]KAI9388352.1 hypothetical protein POPTR_009G050100v4 [Populus trichocarpa]